MKKAPRQFVRFPTGSLLEREFVREREFLGRSFVRYILSRLISCGSYSGSYSLDTPFNFIQTMIKLRFN